MKKNNMSVKDVLAGDERRETIMLTDGTTRYIAESYPGASPEMAVWVCSKFTIVSGTVETANVLPKLQIPGIDGAGLVALFA